MRGIQVDIIEAYAIAGDYAAILHGSDRFRIHGGHVHEYCIGIGACFRNVG